MKQRSEANDYIISLAYDAFDSMTNPLVAIANLLAFAVFTLPSMYEGGRTQADKQLVLLLFAASVIFLLYLRLGFRERFKQIPGPAASAVRIIAFFAGLAYAIFFIIAALYNLNLLSQTLLGLAGFENNSLANQVLFAILIIALGLWKKKSPVA